jgi:hypothetical protein
LARVTWDRRRFLGALIIKPALGLLKQLLTAGAGRQLRRQLIAATIPEALVLVGIDRLGRIEDFAGKALIVDGRLTAGVGRDLAAVHRDDVDADQTGLRTQTEHAAEDLGQRVLVTPHKPGQRRVVGLLLRRQDAIRDVLDTRALDRPRRPDAPRVRVQK